MIHSGITPPTLPAGVGEPLLSSLGAPEERPIACAVGRLARVKGYDILLRAWREGGPITLIEALHVGRPVVSTRVGIAPDWLPDDCLCPTRNARALAATVRRALADREAVDQAFEPIYERARRDLTLDGMAQRVEAVYLDALRQRGVPEGD